jgi:hypothetical protein
MHTKHSIGPRDFGDFGDFRSAEEKNQKNKMGFRGTEENFPPARFKFGWFALRFGMPSLITRKLN